MVTEFEKRKEDRWSARRDTEERLDHRHLKKFKQEVRDAILLLVNEHGVEYRLQADGQHLMLYSGARGERPFKIAAARPVARQMQLLLPWLREHFPEIDLATGKSGKGETTYGIHLFEPNSDEPPHCKVCGFEKDDGRAEHVVEVPKPTDIFPPKKESMTTLTEEDEAELLESEGWEPYVYPTAGPSQFFLVKGDRLRCIAPGCDYTKEGSFAGVHLHEARHTGDYDRMALRAAETRRTRQERQESMLAETLDILLTPHGYAAVKKEDAALIKEAALLREERDRLQKALDELQAKFDLAREAFGL